VLLLMRGQLLCVVLTMRVLLLLAASLCLGLRVGLRAMLKQARMLMLSVSTLETHSGRAVIVSSVAGRPCAESVAETVVEMQQQLRTSSGPLGLDRGCLVFGLLLHRHLLVLSLALEVGLALFVSGCVAAC
jgi:hypothetical protein